MYVHKDTNWEITRDFGSYLVSEQPRLKQGCASAKSLQSLHFLLTLRRDMDDASDKKLKTWVKVSRINPELQDFEAIREIIIASLIHFQII